MDMMYDDDIPRCFDSFSYCCLLTLVILETVCCCLNEL